MDRALPQIQAELAKSPYPLLFATLSGSHLYGFSSANSDYDVRGVHIVPPKLVLGLDPIDDTLDHFADRDGLIIDLVTHDVRVFFLQLLKRNGNVLEQIFSPLVIEARPEFEELKSIARPCITRHHAHHFRGLARSSWQLFEKGEAPEVKRLLYAYRALLAGIHLMRSGTLESRIQTLNEACYRWTFIDELVALKQDQGERALLKAEDRAVHEPYYRQLEGELEEAQDASALPEQPSGHDALNDLLLRLRAPA